MINAFRVHKSCDGVWVQLKSRLPGLWTAPHKLTSDQCKALAYCLLRAATDIEREDIERIQRSLPLNHVKE